MVATAGIQDQVRRNSEATMVARCTILRATSSTPRPGYAAETFAAHLSDVPCYLYNVRVTERDNTDRRVATTQSRLIVPRDTDVTSDDRVATVTMFDETLVNEPDGIEIAVTPNPAHLIIDLMGVS
ncbi:MAG: DUF6093 family protein [Chloroflexota bacterium]|nr:DUF6093 family protein [Chloroflexota bacterium]